MLISIVIPVYKVEEYIERCLQSVIAQDYEGDLECLLIDDCTPDNSCAVIEDILDRYKGPIRFRLLHHEKNRGLSAARNTGIDNAQGDYIYFLDSDDYISSDCISKLAAPLTEAEYDIIIGNYSVLGSTETFPPLRLGKRLLTHNIDIIESYTRYDWYMMAWNKLCNMSFIKRYSLYFREGLIHEDELWSFQCACYANTLKSVDESTYNYCIRKGSIITSMELMEIKKRNLIILGYMLDFLENNGLNNPLYYDFVKSRHGFIKSYMVKTISHGEELDCSILTIYKSITLRLGCNNTLKDRFLNFLIFHANKKWASLSLAKIHHVLSR